MELSKKRMLEIAKALEFSSKNTEINCGKCGATVMKHSEEEVAFYEQVVKLLQADQDGKLKVLPCEIGDTAWGIRNCGGVKYVLEGKIKEIYFSKDMQLVVVLGGIARGVYGEKIFGTKEEAEEALANGV